MKIMVEDSSKYTPIATGTYMAGFDGFEIMPGLEHGDVYRMNFTILGGSYNGWHVNGLCGTVLRPGTKLFDWLSAISGLELAPGIELDTESLIGTYCTIVVEQVQRNGRIYSNVTKVLRYTSETEYDEDGDAPA